MFAPHEPGGPRRQLGEGGGDDLGAELVNRLGEPAHPEIQGVELGVQVAVGMGRYPADAADEVHHVAAQLAAVAQLHRRDEHALLGALGGRRVVVPGNGAPDVGVVPHRGQPAEQPAAAEVGAHQLHVVEVRAAPVGVIEDPDVAVSRAAAGRSRLDGEFDGARHGSREDRQAGGALDQGRPGGGVVDAMGGVVGLGNDGVEGRAEQGGVHLVHELLEPPLENGQRDGIQHGAHPRGSRAAARPAGRGMPLPALMCADPPGRPAGPPRRRRSPGNPCAR